MTKEPSWPRTVWLDDGWLAGCLASRLVYKFVPSGRIYTSLSGANYTDVRRTSTQQLTYPSSRWIRLGRCALRVSHVLRALSLRLSQLDGTGGHQSTRQPLAGRLPSWLRHRLIRAIRHPPLMTRLHSSSPPDARGVGPTQGY